MTWTFEATEAGYANLWRTATLKGGADASQAETFSDKIIAAEQRYKAVQAVIGMPWFLIGAWHMRESGCDFSTHLHNGDPLTARTKHVPAGRPASGSPPFTWPESAIDALQMKGLQGVQSWSVARMLYESERYNGWGYVPRGENSPYVWAGTNHEQRGKFVADGEFDPSADDTQLGVAAVLIRLAEKRPDIHADLYPATPEEKPPVSDPVTPSTDDLVKAIVAQLAAALGPIIANALKGAAPVLPPIAEPAPVIVPDPVPVAPKLPTPGLATGTGIMTGALAIIMQMLGYPVVGEGATTATSAIPAVAIGSAALGLSGWGGLISTGLQALGPLLVKLLGGKSQ